MTEATVFEAVLDASAILALYFDEPGSDLVAQVLARSMISAVNLAEVVTKQLERGMGAAEAEAAANLLFEQTTPVSADLALAAALLHAQIRGRGLSLGDRFCLALAQKMNLPVYTADRAWAELGLDLDIRLIR